MTRKLTVGSLFSGIGGIDLGLERAGMETRWFSEIDAYASKVLAKHWPNVPNHGDITKIDFAAVEPVDVLCGGFPCQDISNAGRREGIGGERSGLWSEYARAIGDLRPGYVFVENVAALLARGLDRVLGDLASLGYDAEWDCIPASAVGAPHRRDRLWLVAYPVGVGRSERAEKAGWQARGAASGLRGCESNQDVADADRSDGHGGRSVMQVGWFRKSRKTAADGYARGTEWSVEPDVGRVAHGIPSRVDRLCGLGNAVVPQIPELIGGWIIEHARASGYLTDAA